MSILSFEQPNWQPPDPIITFNRLRASTEIAAVGSILPDVSAGITAARSAGLSPNHFAQDDCRLIYFALDWAADHGINPLTAVECVLRHHHLWDQSQVSGNIGSMRWNADALRALSARYFSSSALVRMLSERVIDLDCTYKMLAEYQHLYHSGLDAAIAPAAWHLHIGGEPARRWRGREAA